MYRVREATLEKSYLGSCSNFIICKAVSVLHRFRLLLPTGGVLALPLVEAF